MVLDQFRRLEHRVDQPFGKGADKSFFLGKFHSGLQLAHDLVISQYLRIQSGSHAEYMLHRIHPAFDVGGLVETLCIAGCLRAKQFNKLVAASRKPVDLGAVAGGKDKDLVQALQACLLEDIAVLLIVDGKLPSHRGIGFFIIDPGYKEVRYVFKQVHGL